MESLTELQQPKPKGKSSDRATLNKTETAKVDQWLNQINESSKGFLTLTRSDVINFLIREHRDEFSPKELNKIRADNYDPIKHLTWIAPQIKAAIANGDVVRVAVLQQELRGVELSALDSIVQITNGESGDQNANAFTARAKSSKRKKKNLPEAEHKIGTNPTSKSDTNCTDDALKIP